MAKLILTSDGIDSEEIYGEFKKDISSKSKVALIVSASDKKEKSAGNQKSKRIFEKLGAKVDIFDLEFQKPQLLFDYDVIYLGGGNPFMLWHFIKQSNSEKIFNELYNSNKILVGVSAGSMILGQNFGIAQYLTPDQNLYDMTDFSGLGFCDKSFSPHSNAFPSIFEGFDEKVARCEKELGIKITKLYDGHALVYDENSSQPREIGGEVVEL